MKPKEWLREARAKSAQDRQALLDAEEEVRTLRQRVEAWDNILPESSPSVVSHGNPAAAAAGSKTRPSNGTGSGHTGFRATVLEALAGSTKGLRPRDVTRYINESDYKHVGTTALGTRGRE